MILPEGERQTLSEIAGQLERRERSSVELTEACLAKALDVSGQGSIAFIELDAECALHAARQADRLRAERRQPSHFCGIPVSVKDVFAVEGQVTRAGSKVFESKPEPRDATAVARIRAAGFVILGRTNMTEFAYSGLGINPHYGTPLSPWRPAERRLAGGSTSGGAASVAFGMAHATLGTDTGGSCRIPAAWCGLTGFKPTATSVPKDGVIPLSFTLDSIGPIARSVGCCAALHSLLSDTQNRPQNVALTELRVGVLEQVVMDGIEPFVATAFVEFVDSLGRTGASVSRFAFPELALLGALNAEGGFAAAESFLYHQQTIETRRNDYDPRVVSRIERGKGWMLDRYANLHQMRNQLIAAFEHRMAAFDVVIMPTTPIVPPKLDDLESDEEYARVNLLALRNPSIANLVDGCSISLPIGDAVGAMLVSPHGHDGRLLAIAEAIELSLPRPVAH